MGAVKRQILNRLAGEKCVQTRKALKASRFYKEGTDKELVPTLTWSELPRNHAFSKSDVERAVELSLKEGEVK